MDEGPLTADLPLSGLQGGPASPPPHPEPVLSSEFCCVMTPPCLP